MIEKTIDYVEKEIIKNPRLAAKIMLILAALAVVKIAFI